jgi:transcriptional regulator with XRE-family HTH domain
MTNDFAYNRIVLIHLTLKQGGDEMDGKKRRDLRKASGRTLRSISIESGVTESQILNLENGTTTNPRVETLLGLAKALGCEVSDFLK